MKPLSPSKLFEDMQVYCKLIDILVVDEGCYFYQGEEMSLTTDGNTLPEPYKTAWQKGTEAVDTSPEVACKLALMLSFYATLNQTPKDKAEAIAYAAGAILSRVTGGETTFYGVDTTAFVESFGWLSEKMQLIANEQEEGKAGKV